MTSFTPSRGVIHKTRSEHPQMAFASGYSRKNAIYRDVVEGIKLAMSFATLAARCAQPIAISKKRRIMQNNSSP